MIFLFSLSYLLLYSYFGLPIIPFIGDRLAAPVDNAWQLVCPWVAVHVFHLSGPVTQYHPTGSGDTTLDYVRVLCIAVLSGLIAVVWFIVDRRGEAPRFSTLGSALSFDSFSRRTC
jgi:hypothetical protein